jgi:hypothetical protein
LLGSKQNSATRAEGILVAPGTFPEVVTLLKGSCPEDERAVCWAGGVAQAVSTCLASVRL